MSVPKHHIREAVARYVSGEITRQELQEWFAPVAWELLAGPPSPAADLAGEIELLLAEATNEGWPDNELRQRLAEAAAVPLSWMVHVQSPLAISVTGGPLQNTILAHQETFWVKVTNEEVEQAA
jgi:hypothetical protein